VKVHEVHEHIDDYDKFIKEQSDPTSHAHHTVHHTTTAKLPEHTLQNEKKTVTTVSKDG